jgi:GntR family transcriptional regulator
VIYLELNPAAERPIYGQIADRLKFAVASGVLRPGDLIPSVRELSKQLVVNPNTVARAYRDLQTEGLVEPVRGMGLQVANGAVERCRSDRAEMVRKRLREAIEEARRSEMDPTEIVAILREEWDRVVRPGGDGPPTPSVARGDKTATVHDEGDAA